MLVQLSSWQTLYLKTKSVDLLTSHGPYKDINKVKVRLVNSHLGGNIVYKGNLESLKRKSLII